MAPRAGTLLREITDYYGPQEPTVPISEAATGTHGLAEMLRGRHFDVDTIRAIVDGTWVQPTRPRPWVIVAVMLMLFAGALIWPDLLRW
ncbi:hypothetical protein [Cupriavidus sp. UYPR2.512]|uniref:hypothetical protein n=1 Tax=Cupriavidus sp. UYPR2.512 TaxID=1080187 RepID=UPI00037373BA|nr:hypothetical protein [Cupriavidus sp. UYPR2.512]